MFYNIYLRFLESKPPTPAGRRYNHRSLDPRRRRHRPAKENKWYRVPQNIPYIRLFVPRFGKKGRRPCRSTGIDRQA
jgi:hypothetical protein